MVLVITGGPGLLSMAETNMPNRFVCITLDQCIVLITGGSDKESA